MTTAIETLSDRLSRLAVKIEDISDTRMQTLAVAHSLGASDKVFMLLVDAERVGRGSTIVLPFQRFELTSRGRGWARQGKGSSAQWGEREDKGYRVGPGSWTVGGNDGFNRKGEVKWHVAHVAVGDMTWTIASN